jgi:hypothetical protein
MCGEEGGQRRSPSYISRGKVVGYQLGAAIPSVVSSAMAVDWMGKGGTALYSLESEPQIKVMAVETARPRSSASRFG